ncbi:SusC/RagA family TonB-linked outer membrane protein [Salinibacter ruber]|uniref:SusC/RagA family TonB-linked outer membrane protein n=1 Tax=Salinibacter ruber TaxID=146919 RepID=UPI0021696626|nr:TonB-dependent receptor [Salinibacter ruber]MCS3757327.1 TonB-linked SusC/RagA family outer membrane protein [Salinibacter ruber]MCS3956186.1 TonB-linked SusC/RagA family outer membrane protein [Salinibacter ruber]
MTRQRWSYRRAGSPHLMGGIALLGFLLLVPGEALGQEGGRIEGRVTSANNGEPLPGANVVAQGTDEGTATGAEGAFSIENVAPGQYTLKASFIGFQAEVREIAVASGETTQVNFVLRPSVQNLEETVVVGYTEKSRREITSSVETVGEAELNDVTVNDAASLLQGKSSGLYVTTGSGDPGADPTIRVRGTGSISAGADPLYVVDGTISGGVLPDPSNIKSVTVLKDAAASALYGSRAANGVVLINTKQGERGSETKVSVQASTGFNRQTTGNFSVMDASQLEGLHGQMEGSPYAGRDFSQNTDWQDLAFRTATTNSIEASVTGGSENTSFYLSGNVYREEGTLKNDKLTRFGGRVNISHSVTQDLTVDTRLNGRYTDETNNPTGALYEAYTNLPWDAPRAGDGSFRTGRESDWIGRDNTNFLYPLQYNEDKSRQYDFNGAVKLDYSLSSWLSFETTNQVTLQRDDADQYRDIRTQAGSNNDGELFNSYAESTTLLSSSQFSFDRSVGKHNAGGIAGFEYETNHYSGFDAEGGGVFPNLRALDVSAEAVGVQGTITKSNFVSGFSQFNYNYDRTYFASVSFRRDGSSKFGENNRYGNFYSIAGSWALNNEPFLEGRDWIQELKLRASYGTTGNASIGNFVARELYDFAAPYNGEIGARATQQGNPNLTWEIARKTNVGVDLSVFDRVDLSVDAYRRINDDLLQNVPQPSVTGYTSQIQNVGKVQNQGLEVSLSTINLQEGVRWTTDFNIGFNSNEVLDLAGGEPVLDVPNANQRLQEGEEIRTWYMRKWAGVDPQTGKPLWEKQITNDQGKVVDTELTSNYNEATLQMLGSASPDFTGGLRNTVEYNGITLSTFFNFVYGNKVYHSARELFDSDGGYLTYNYMELEDDWSRWQEPGDDATHPKPVAGGNSNSNDVSSRYIEDGTYLRLKNVRLSYNIPSAWLRSLNLQSARVYVSGDNLLTLTDFSGMDPEVGLDGVAGTKYPISRKVIFGVGVSF